MGELIIAIFGAILVKVGIVNHDLTVVITCGLATLLFGATAISRLYEIFFESEVY